jgi:hypothetical protein
MIVMIVGMNWQFENYWAVIGSLQCTCCEMLLGVRNPEEGQRPPLEADTKQLP